MSAEQVEARPALRTVTALLPGSGLARMLVLRNALALKNFWMVMASGFFEPVFYLFSIGVGVGALVGTVTDSGRQFSYAEFVAPALMATSAMNGAIYDSTMNVYFKLRHAKVYEMALATPIGVTDVAVGEICWALLRGLSYSIGFYVIMLALGLTTSWWAVLSIPACAVIGFAFAAIGMAGTTFARGWSDLEYVQLVVMPLFLFSATFYPLSVYPPAWQWVVQVTPLYHGVALIRQLTTGAVGLDALVHVGYLLTMGIVGLWLVSRRLRSLLYT